jgi:hypothetical protein
MPKTQELTPAQLAEIEESKKSWTERFKELVDEAHKRHKEGTSLSPAFVNSLEELYLAFAEAQKPKEAK